jgi:hypothetical protein
VALTSALVAGGVLRLVWVEDMEYKLDEAWSFKHAHAAGKTEVMPLTGMSTSLGPPNPGLSLWTFWVLVRVFPGDGPTDLARACQVLNVVALGLLVGFVLASIPRGEREPWLWAAALGAVNPLAVLFQRKIWPPSVGPSFTVLWLAGWWHRRRPAGAFAWGLVGALLGQLHAMGFFLAAGLWLFTLLLARRGVCWKAWFVGSVVGTIPMLPWLYVLATHPTPVHDNRAPALRRLVEAKFWTMWTSEAVGLGLKHPLGEDYSDFLGRPLWHGKPTHLVYAVQAMCILAGSLVLLRAARSLWRGRNRLRARLLGGDTQTGQLAASAFWGFGLLLSAACLCCYRHYLVIAYPLPLLWGAVLALRGGGTEEAEVRKGRALLLTLWVGQLILSVSFLRYVHRRDDCIRGDYGLPYRVQVQNGNVQSGGF